MSGKINKKNVAKIKNIKTYNKIRVKEVVIDNYANGLSTQPLYLHKHISEKDEHEVTINAFTPCL